jgi:hypothetical protein
MANTPYIIIHANSIGNKSSIDSIKRKTCIPIPNNPVIKNNNKL